MTDARIARIRAQLEHEGWDAIVLTNTHDVVYTHRLQLHHGVLDAAGTDLRGDRRA